MIVQKKHETRLEYLARVLHALMTDTVAGEQTIEYDGATCDGQCLANDFVSELGLDDDEF